MGQLREISTELWPLIDVRKVGTQVLLSIFDIFYRFLQTLHES